MIENRKPILEKGYRLTLPAPLFLYVLKVLKQKNGFDSMGLCFFERISQSIFGSGYINNNWDVTKELLLANEWIEIFSTCVERGDFHRLIRITGGGMWLIENGEPDDYWKEDIKTVTDNLKLK